jgi:5-formyltetrahydrofolate cyclo-ligase
MDLIGTLPPSSPIGGYFAIRDELDPLPLLQTLHRSGFRMALPKMCPGPALKFKEWAPNLPLMPGKFGVHEPAEEQPELLPSFVLVPLLAFDREGNRLGYGAGYYDAALRKFKDGGNRVIAIGIGFDEQEFPEIPREPRDEPLDMILTPTRVIACGDRHAASLSR